LWTVPVPNNFISYTVIYGVTGSPATNFTSTSNTFLKIVGLPPGQSITFTVVGNTPQGLTSLPSPTLTVQLAPPDAKLIPADDIHNITCTTSKNAATNRVDIVCNWSAATPVSPKKLSLKCHCISPIREPVLIRKKYYNAKAAITTKTFNINRDVTSCAIYFHAYYPRPAQPNPHWRATTRHSLVVLVGE